jgi:hypothetical protein
MAQRNGFHEEDVGNIIQLEHVNFCQPDQQKAIAFYIVGMGFTRDPYMTVGLNNMWVNVGEQQFHLPTRAAQVLDGHVGLVVPDLRALQERLDAVAPALEGTKFAYKDGGEYVAVTCPWGNEFRVYAPAERFGRMFQGIPYVEINVRPNTAPGIARFYQQVMGAPTDVEKKAGGPVARVHIGENQELIYRERADERPPYDGYHIAVYVANFSGPYAFFKKHNLITEEPRNHQLRFQDILDPKSGETLATLEHEVRSLRHNMYGREMVNRNADQVQATYVRGRDKLASVAG